MIIDVILNIFIGLLNFVLAILPNFSFIDNLIQAKENFIDFMLPIMQHTLYVFNVPILRFSVGLLFTYISFLAIEYTIKLNAKYITRVLWVYYE